MTLVSVAHVLTVWLVMHAERPELEELPGWLGSGRIASTSVCGPIRMGAGWR